MITGVVVQLDWPQVEQKTDDTKHPVQVLHVSVRCGSGCDEWPSLPEHERVLAS